MLPQEVVRVEVGAVAAAVSHGGLMCCQASMSEVSVEALDSLPANMKKKLGVGLVYDLIVPDQLSLVVAEIILLAHQHAFEAVRGLARAVSR